MRTTKPNKTKTEEKRETLVYGYSWLRYLMMAALVFQVLYLSNYPDLGLGYLITTAVFTALYFLFKNARKIMHDSHSLYLMRDKKETTIPFTHIISIKKSKSRVNGSRFWKLIYKDDINKKVTIRFFSDFNKEFHNLVRQSNPDVVIWTHPFFNN